MLTIYISEALPPDKSLVASPSSPVPTILPNFVLGDCPTTFIQLVDGAGNIAADSGNGELNVAIGIPGQTPISQEGFISSTQGWIGKLQLNTQALVTLIGGLNILNATLQVQLLDVNGQPQTMAMIPIKIAQSVLPVSLSSNIAGLILGSDGLIYQMTALIINGVPTIQPILYGNQNVTAPNSVTIKGNDGNNYTYIVQVINGVPTLVKQ